MTLWFDELREGQVFETASRLVSAGDIVAFAELTGDRNRIHLDGLAHGVLVAGISSGLLFELGHFGESTLALLELKEWKFLGPVRAGDEVRARITIEALRPASSGGKGVVTRRVEILTQRGETVQDGRAVVLVATRPSG